MCPGFCPHPRLLIDFMSDFYLETCHRDDFRRFVAEIDAEEARQEESYGGRSNYKQNMLYGKEGLYARLGNAILRELKEFDKYNQEQYSKVQSAMREIEAGDNREQAIKTIRKMADGGNVSALNMLGFMHLKGKYVERNKVLAKRYFGMAADKRDNLAKRVLNNWNHAGRYSYMRSRAKNDIRKGLWLLEKSMRNTYLKMRNIQEAEILRMEIEMRGETFLNSDIFELVIIADK